MTDTNVESIRAKLLDRSQRGMAKYGCTTAEARLSRDEWLMHLQEELLDAAVYVEALKNAAPQWYPMANIPAQDDGRPVVVACATWTAPRIAYWDVRIECWRSWDSAEPIASEPTHWIPLPELPKDDGND